MKIDFQPAFAVDLGHDYYPDGVSRDFRIRPTAQGRRTLSRHGLLFKETPTGFVVLYEAAGSGNPAVPKRPLASGLVLSFALWPRSPLLLHVADLPIDKPADQIFYLTNRDRSLRDGKRLLTAGTGPGFVSASDLMALKPRRFQVDVETGAGSVFWELFDAQGAPVETRRAPTVEGSASCVFSLDRRPPQRYRLRRDGVDHLRFYADDRMVGARPFGLVEIADDQTVSNDFRFVDDLGNVRFRRYQANLKVRETTWEYRVVAKYDRSVDPADVTVTLDAPPVAFTREAEVALPDGSTAIPFVAGAPLPFSHRPLKGIALHKKKGASTPKIDMANLPNPSAAHMIPAGGGKWISRVYVYV